MRGGAAGQHPLSWRNEKSGTEGVDRIIMDDTIAAISTALSGGGIGVVRISGPDALAIGDQIFIPHKKEKKILNLPAYTAAYGSVIAKPKDDANSRVIDECIALVMRGPGSYTGENVVELQCHGGAMVLKKVLEASLEAGARLAEPGEFTKRAFLNGRVDLSQAEAVMDVIRSKNEFALQSAVSQLRGGLKNKISAIREKLLYQLAYLESALDDPEHISLEGYGDRLRKIVTEEKQFIDHLVETAENGKILKEGIRTAIVGKPNAGKSSLLNLLVGEERAIVTEVAGTTRDTLEESIKVNGISLQLIDTAGIRKTENLVEQIGIRRAKEAMEEADLVLYVADSSVPLSENDYEIMEELKNKKAIVLLNKSDLEEVVGEKEMRKHVNQDVIVFSTKDETGLKRLYDKISELFFHGSLSFNEEVYITNLRHKRALMQASESLSMVLSSIEDGMPEDFYSIDLRDAYEHLGSILGESMGEDLIDKIFQEFCMGK